MVYNFMIKEIDLNIEDEREAQRMYRKLIKLLNQNKVDSDGIEMVLMDEVKHEEFLKKLKRKL